MAIRFPLDKIKEEKAEYIKYLRTNLHEPAIPSMFPYSQYYDIDSDVINVRKEIRQTIAENERKLEMQKVTHSDKHNKQENKSKNKQNNVVPQNQQIQKELGEIRMLLGVTKKKRFKTSTVTQVILDDCLRRLNSIEPTELFDDAIKSLKGVVAERQAYLNVQKYVVQLYYLEQEKDNAIFHSKFEDFKQQIQSLALSDKESEIIDAQIAMTIKNREENVYAQSFLEYSNSLTKRIEQIKKKSESAKEIVTELNKLIDEVKDLNFERTEISVLIRSIKQAIHKVNEPITNISHSNDVTPTNIDNKKREKQVAIIIESEYIISWQNIEFGNGVITFSSKEGRILYRQVGQFRRSYNQIKEYLSDKLPQIVLVYRENSKSWQLKQPLTLQKALQMIRRKESEDLLQEEQYRKAVHSYDNMSLYIQNPQNQEIIYKRLKDKKQQFLNYLIRLQLNNYKLIPAIEIIAHESSESTYEEDVFIFSIPCKNSRYGSRLINIVYENVNPARATIICTVEERYYQQALQSIFNFMNDENEKNKRSRLHQIIRLNIYVRNLHISVHKDLHTWAVSVQH